MRETLLLGRIFYSLIFVVAALGHFTQPTIDYAASQGVPYPGLMVPLSGLLALASGLSIALGYRARIGGWLLVLFLVPVTLMMHDFWNVSDAGAAMIQQQMFFKNLALLGGAFAFTYFGSGPYSLDSRLATGTRRDVRVGRVDSDSRLGTSIPTSPLNERDLTNSRTW